jgi:hypothetical protein
MTAIVKENTTPPSFDTDTSLGLAGQGHIGAVTTMVVLEVGATPGMSIGEMGHVPVDVFANRMMTAGAKKLVPAMVIRSPPVIAAAVGVTDKRTEGRTDM